MILIQFNSKLAISSTLKDGFRSNYREGNCRFLIQISDIIIGAMIKVLSFPINLNITAPIFSLENNNILYTSGRLGLINRIL